MNAKKLLHKGIILKYFGVNQFKKQTIKTFLKSDSYKRKVPHLTGLKNAAFIGNQNADLF